MEELTRELLEKRLGLAEQALERCDRLAVASRYASAVMHEVNNPLEAITNLVYLTKQNPENLSQVVENMSVIEDQLTTLGRVTRQSLTFHREQAALGEFYLADITEAALKLHSDKMIRHGVLLDHRLRRPAKILAFGSEILQVVSNLILNALDAVPPSGGRLYVRVGATTRAVSMTLTDNGSGIPKEAASKLFQPYFTSKPTGTGLGLWLSERIVKRHGGTLRFRSSRLSLWQGTSFRLELPNAPSKTRVAEASLASRL